MAELHLIDSTHFPLKATPKNRPRRHGVYV
jgi:hypothetical protein